MLAAGSSDLMLRVLPQLVLLLLIARLGGAAMRRLGQPRVVGEIAAGLLLGPSLFGAVWPEGFESLFGDVGPSSPLALLGQLGLVFLTLLMGMEFEFAHLRTTAKTAAAVALGGIALPFTIGTPLAWMLHEELHLDVPLPGMALFLSTALSITSIPVLGSILLEHGLTRTRFGVVAITAAGLDDALGWILLATVSAIVAGGGAMDLCATMLAATAGFVVVTLFVVRPLLVRLVARRVAAGEPLSLGGFSLVLGATLACAYATERIGVFALFGSFVLGASLWNETALRDALKQKLAPVVDALFLPVFFALTGLRTNVGQLDTATEWLLCGVMFVAACVGKVVGCAGAARLFGMPLRESLCVGVLMNTRALMGLVAIEVGRSIGVIDGAVYTMLVLMAVATTLMTTPLLRRLAPGSRAAASLAPPRL
jgi:Kef-type K+ transport system membrane component KefB